VVKYGLEVDGSLLGFTTQSNDGADCSVSVQYTLEPSKYSENLWLVETQGAAEFVANTSTDWFNAGYETPTNPFVGQCRVVKVTLTVEAS
jgi:hypothetical protein